AGNDIYHRVSLDPVALVHGNGLQPEPDANPDTLSADAGYAARVASPYHGAVADALGGGPERISQATQRTAQSGINRRLCVDSRRNRSAHAGRARTSRSTGESS